MHIRGVSIKKHKYFYTCCMFETRQRQIFCGTNLELSIWLRMLTEYLEYGKLLPNRKY